MNVVRLHSVGDLRLHDEAVPAPGPDEALVRVTAVDLCGSDLHWFGEAGIGDARLAKPLVLGHEFAGVTEAGQRVAVDPAVSCGVCKFCQEGNPNLCAALRFAGHGREDGALREWMAWPARCLIPIPDSLSDADGALLEPLGVALHAVDLGKIRAGMRVGVFGCGPLGLLVLQVARVAGAAEVLVTEPLAHRLAAAQRLGAKEWLPGQEVDVAFECAGENGAVEDALAAVRPGGRVVLVGIPGDDRTTFTASVARRKGLTIKLSRRMKHTYPRAVRLVAEGLVDVRSLVTHRFPLEKTLEAFGVAGRREGLKVIVGPG
ncbi:MAG TPA: alcohol dehydrogenase catalytic domain-containing protein [Anaerolineales bacterium]|nr:alcohol dehydrogenase catalytic domain-containing protein [Anaerolineales bacterium]